MITVENDRIRVTVTQAVWDQYADQAKRLAHKQRLPSGDVHEHTPEQIQRGLILSEAMSKLGNASELRLLEQEGPDNDTILQHTKLSLMFHYLEQHGAYDAVETMQRVEGGKMMPQGMRAAVLEASAYAEGQLSPLRTDEARAEFLRYLAESLATHTDLTQRELCFRKKMMELKSAPMEEITATMLSETAQLLNYLHDADKQHRRRFSNMTGWEIEIIGDMPEEIGLCRYRAKGAA